MTANPLVNHDRAEIRRIHDPARIHRFLRRHLRLPDPVADRLVQFLIVARNPADQGRRRRMALGLADGAAGAGDVPRDAGFLRFDAGALPGQDAAVGGAQGVFETLASNGGLAAARAKTNKPFLINLLRDGEFLAHPAVFRFIVSRPVIDVAARYLRTIPVLATVRLWWTPANDTRESSQLFHRDAEGPTQLKFFFHLTPVGPRSGPLTFVPADVSARAMRRLGYRRGKLDDADLRREGVFDHAIVLTGDPGTGAALDTSRCLHLGSRGNEEDRVVLMFQYTPATCPRAAPPSWGPGLAPYLGELDEIQRLALNRAP